MKSKGDPILDLQALCEEEPRNEAALKAAYEALGWGPAFQLVLSACIDIYVEKREDGLYHKRDENARDQLKAVYERARGTP